MKAWKDRCNFKNLLFKDKKIMKILSKKEIDKLFNLNKILININKIYDKIGLK